MTAQPSSVRHVILNEPLRCFAQMITAAKLAEQHHAVTHLTGACAGKPTRNHPGMASGCVAPGPAANSRCMCDLAALDAEGAIYITSNTICWSRDGDSCPYCKDSHGEKLAAAEVLALW